ncbi:MAG TPA: LamG domain-containing protein [Candidatus Acidoferrales bacterium]|jgi:hypothetical protein|nr:LamG domain-containing protein [Candidatus Acidoferrales bacterium]
MRNLLILSLLALPAYSQCTGYGTSIAATVEQVTGTLTNVAEPISITDTRLATTGNGGLSLSTGNDICISDSGNTVAFPLQKRPGSYSATTGAYAATVLFPSLSASATTSVLVWVGKASASDPSTTAVWNSNYKQVYQLGETGTPGAGGAGVYLDSTVNAMNSVTGTINPTSVAGIAGFGNAQSFNGTNQFIQVTNALASGAPGTIQAWFNVGTHSTSPTVVDNRANGTVGCAIYMDTSGFVHAFCNSAGLDKPNAVNVANGVWHQAVLTVNTGGVGVTLYVDGTLIGASGPQAFGGFSAGSDMIGRNVVSGGTSWFPGKVQEVRISSVVEGAAQIKADYDAMHAPTSFFALSSLTCSITTTTLPAGTVGVSYSQTLATSNCTTPAFSVTAGALPTGLTLGSSTGTIGTTATASCNPCNFTAHVIDSGANGNSSQALSIVMVTSTPVISAVSAAGNSPSSLLLTWTTDVKSTSNINCGVVTGGPYTIAAGGSVTPILHTATTGLGQGVLTHIVAVTGLPNPSTPYFCVPLSGQPGGLSATGAEVTASTLPAVVSTPISISYVSPVTRYNDQFPANGRAWNGDTHYCSWADDGNSYCNYDDGSGVGATHSALGYSKWPTATDLTYTNVTVVSANTTFGTESQANNPTGYADGGVWGGGVPISVRGIMYYPSFRAAGAGSLCLSLLLSNDHGATTQSPEHNLSGAGYTGVANGDAPSPGNCMLAGAPGPWIWFIQHCQDHSMNCTWVANADGYVYATGWGNGGYGGTAPFYNLMRVRIEDLLLQLGSKIQYYIGTGAGSDGLFDAAWSFSATGTCPGATCAFRFPMTTMGAQPMMVFVPNFNRYMAVGWLWLAGNAQGNTFGNAAAAVISDVGPYPWNVSTQIATIPRDNTHLNYGPAFTQFHLESYVKRSTTPLSASIKIVGTGYFTGEVQGTPSTDEYSPHIYEVGLVPRATVPARPAIGNGRNQHIATGLDLFYNFQNCSNALSLPDLSPNGIGLNHKYDAATNLVLGSPVTTPNTLNPAVCDNYGMWNFGISSAANKVATCTPACATPMAYPLVTPYNVALTDFTVAVSFAHYPAGNGSTGLATVSGELVLDKTDLQLARSSTTANSWTLKVGATTSSPFSLTTDVAAGGATWPALFIRRVGGTVNVYSSAGIGATAPFTTLATISDGTALSTNALNIGTTFRGTMSELLVWNRGLTDSEIAREAGAIRYDMALRGLVIP